MKSAIKYALSIALVICTSGCVTVEPHAPNSEPFQTPPSVPDSQFFTKVTFSYDDIEQRLASFLGHQETPYPSTHWLDTVVRLTLGYKGDVTLDITNVNISGQGDNFSVQVKFDGNVRSHRLNDRNQDDTDFSGPHASVTGDVTATINLKLNSNWTVNSHTDINLNLSNAKICLVDDSLCWISVKDDLSTALKPKLDEFAARIDEKIQSMNFAARADEPWQALQNPIPINQAPPISLVVNPSSVLASPFMNDSSAVIINAGIVASPLAETFAQVPPAPHVRLPDLASNSPISNEFHMRLRATAAFDDISSYVNGKLAGTEISIPGGNITINSVEIYTTGQSLVAKVNFHARTGLTYAKGFLYLTGKPDYDSGKRAFTITKFDFDPQTNNALVQFASYILHSGLREKLESQISGAEALNMGPKLDGIQTQLQNKLKGVDLTPNVQLSGSISNVGIGGVYVAKEGLVLDGIADGWDKVEFH